VSHSSVFSQAELKRRRAQLARGLGELEADAALLWSPGNLCYFTGNDIAGGHALLVFADGRTVVVADEYDQYNFVRLASNDLEVQAVPYTESVFSAVAALLGEQDRVKCLAVELVDVRHEVVNTASANERTIVPLDGLLRRIRLVKSQIEIDQVRAAAATTHAALTSATSLLMETTSEAAVAAAIYQALIMNGSEHVASQPYVKAGERALLTHARWGSRRIDPEDHVLIEVAGSVNRYHAPLMRTRLTAARSSDYERAIQGVVAGRDAYLRHATAGTTGDDLHERYLEALDEHGVADWNRHACGYSVGVGIAPYWGEVGLLTISRGSEIELRPGMILHLISGVIEPARDIPHVGLSECVLITDGEPERLLLFPDFL
jgi:Xaa-Pro dipeptidase